MFIYSHFRKSAGTWRQLVQIDSPVQISLETEREWSVKCGLLLQTKYTPVCKIIQLCEGFCSHVLYIHTFGTKRDTVARPIPMTDTDYWQYVVSTCLDVSDPEKLPAWVCSCICAHAAMSTSDSLTFCWTSCLNNLWHFSPDISCYLSAAICW